MTSEAPGQVVPTARSGVVRSSLLVLIGRLAFGATVVVQNVVFAHVMGAQEFGLFLLVQNLVLPVAIFAVFGLDSLAIRELRDPRRNISRIAPASFLRVSIVAIAVVTSIAVAALLPTI